MVAEAYIDINREYLNGVGHKGTINNSSDYIEVNSNNSKVKSGCNFEGRIKYKYSGNGHATMAYTLQDESRGGRVYDSGHIEVSRGEREVDFKLSMDQFNSTDFRVVATLHEAVDGEGSRMIANTFDGGDFRFKYETKKSRNDYGLIKSDFITKK